MEVITPYRVAWVLSAKSFSGTKRIQQQSTQRERNALCFRATSGLQIPSTSSTHKRLQKPREFSRATSSAFAKHGLFLQTVPLPVHQLYGLNFQTDTHIHTQSQWLKKKRSKTHPPILPNSSLLQIKKLKSREGRGYPQSHLECYQQSRTEKETVCSLHEFSQPAALLLNHR